MIVKVDDLQAGDDIIVGANSQLRWFKVLTCGKLNKRGDKFTSFRCSTKVDVIQVPIYTYPTGAPTKYRNKKVYECTPDGHNMEMYVSLDWKGIWLMTRNGNRV